MSLNYDEVTIFIKGTFSLYLGQDEKMLLCFGVFDTSQKRREIREKRDRKRRKRSHIGKYIYILLFTV